VKAQGRDNVEGAIRATDAISIEALITGLSGAALPSQVRLGTSQNFSSCSAALNGSLCQVRFPASGEQGFDAGEMLFTVTLFGNGSTTLDSRQGSVIVDALKPSLSFDSLSPQNFGSQNITFAYTATDTACNGSSCSGKCSGIRGIEFFSINNSFSDEVNVNTRNCTFSSAYVKHSTEFPSGTTALFARVTDMVGHVSNPSSVGFFVDASGPQIKPDSLKILYKGKDLAHFAPGRALSVFVQVNVSDSALDTDTVFADLHALNPSDNSLNRIEGTCSGSGNSSLCQWNVVLLMDTAGPKQLRFNASDMEGNPESAIFTRTFAVDTTGPEVTSLSSSSGAGAFASPVATLKAQVTEAGAGLAPEDMFISVNGLEIAATSCNASSCTWEDVALGAGDVDVGISGSSTDLLGNRASLFSQTFTIDSTLPVITDGEIKGIGGLTGQSGDFVGVGDRIGISLNITEDTEIASVSANLSAFIPGASSVSGTCENSGDNIFLCSIISDPVERAATGMATVTVVDAAGNSAIISRELRTYATNSNLTPNFWTSSVSCSPRVLDRQLGTLIEQREYCTVSLAQRSPGTSPRTVAISLAGCTGDGASSGSNLIQSAAVFNTNAGSTSPLIKLTLKKDSLNINEIRTSCTLNILTVSGGYITQSPEQEIVPITIQLFDNPLGTLDAGVQAKIDAAMEATKGTGKLIGTLNKVMFIAKRICQLFGVIYGLVSFAVIVGVKLEVVEATTCTSVLGLPACPATYTTKEAYCEAQQKGAQAADVWYLTGGKFCKFVNCEWSPEIIEKMKGWSSEMINKATPGAELFKYFPEGSPAGALSPKSSLATSVLFACIPGIIENLDKYRQIDCLYADCLLTAVKEDNVPITACENLKAQATCKYVMGEVFAIVPFTALFDIYAKLLKQALSDPFSAVGLAIGAGCWATCKFPALSGFPYAICEPVKAAAKLGEVLKQVKSIAAEGFSTNVQDYCTRLEGKTG
ncbi:MAG: hypothetical protein HY518_05855, partial [Candidatus Aenigmarchaeota archaeon]|nr:hypothetical protein [Candidatus Aenigmarchaeota archaeon]